jgi:hypothetical protein
VSGRLTPPLLAGIAGTGLLTLGVLGFVPGVVENSSQLELWKNGSRAELLHVFQISLLTNLVHIGAGVVGLVCTRSWVGSRLFLLWSAIVCLGLWVFRLAIGQENQVNVLPLSRADGWLYLGLAAVLFVFAGLAARDEPRGRPVPAAYF